MKQFAQSTGIRRTNVQAHFHSSDGHCLKNTSQGMVRKEKLKSERQIHSADKCSAPLFPQNSRLFPKHFFFPGFSPLVLGSPLRFDLLGSWPNSRLIQNSPTHYLKMLFSQKRNNLGHSFFFFYYHLFTFSGSQHQFFLFSHSMHQCFSPSNKSLEEK